MLIRCRRCGEQLDTDAKFCGSCGAPLTDADIGRVVAGRYHLVERLGSGSLGIVYRAEQLGGLKRKLAIKILPPDARDPQTVERFRREGALLCRLRSPHTVTTYEFDREEDGSLYIAMELSDGQSLAKVFRDQGPLDWRRVLRILVGLCDSLGEAHGLGVIHRDIKPENALLEVRASNHDFVRVLDFGLAKLITTDVSLSPAGQTVGAVEYNAPEMLLSRPIDARSDLYSLGVLAFLLVTGRHPFHEHRSFGDMVNAHLHVVPPPASSVRDTVPTDVDAIIARLLEKDPARRYPDAAALAASVNLLLMQPGAQTSDTIREMDIPITGEEDTAFADVNTGPPAPKSK